MQLFRSTSARRALREGELGAKAVDQLLEVANLSGWEERRRPYAGAIWQSGLAEHRIGRGWV